MACNEVGLVDVVGRLDGLIAEAQVGNGDTRGLLRVVLEVSLDILVGVVTDDLDGIASIVSFPSRAVATTSKSLPRFLTA